MGTETNFISWGKSINVPSFFFLTSMDIFKNYTKNGEYTSAPVQMDITALVSHTMEDLMRASGYKLPFANGA